MTVITVSREFGSGGDEVASRLCEVLGYRSFGKEQILAAARDTNLSNINAVDYHEDNHEVQSFLDRLFGRSATPVQVIAWNENPSIASRPARADVHELAVLSLVKRAIRAAGQTGNMVIVGRGGQVLLKGKPGVLHVRLIAPYEDRVRRVVDQQRSQPGQNRSEKELIRTAAELITNRDIASADYVRKYFDAEWSDPRLYHLVINLGQFTIEQAVQIIAGAVPLV